MNLLSIPKAFILSFVLIHPAQCQSCLAFKSIRANSLDTISLTIAESEEKFSVFEKVFLMRSNVDLDRREMVKNYLLSLALDGFYKEDILDVKSINGGYINELLSSDLIFRNI